MFILLTIFLFIFIPLVMLIFHLIQPRLNVQGFLAVLGVLAGWILVFLARSDIPRIIPLFQWKPDSLFAISPSLIIDEYSWYFALALTSLALSVVVTSIAQLGNRPIPNQALLQNQVNSVEGQKLSDDGYQSIHPNAIPEVQLPSGWLLWASILILISLGLLAVTAGNILTLLLAWTAVDMIELVILIGLMRQSRVRERIILAFSAKMAGMCIVLIAGILQWSQSASLSFDTISGTVGIYLVLAAGIRLGILPLHLPFSRGLPISRNLGTVLRLVPAASSYILLLRVSSVGVTGAITPYLLGFTILAGVYAAINWLRAKNELDGRPYWLLGTSSMVVAAAILHHPAACLAWSIVSLLSGGLIFSMFLRHKNLIPLVVLGWINLSALPFSPTWRATELYQFSASPGLNLPVFSLLSVMFLLIQAFLLAGFIRHALRGVFLAKDSPSAHTERWVWFLYPLGLVFIVVTHLLIGILIYPPISEVPLSGWIMGPAVLIFTGIILYLAWRYSLSDHPSVDPNIRSAWDRLFSLDWFYRFLWSLFRTISRVFGIISTVLEGDGGLLWALVLFGLVFVFLQR